MDEEAKMREHELDYLRGELNQRVNFTCEHTHKTFGHIMLLWGGTLALFNAKGNSIGDIPALFIVATVFFISVVVLYFLSRMDFESKKTISQIAAYITIFYEKRPSKEKDKKIFWELSRFEIRKTKKSNWKYNNKSNDEYFWFSIIAICVISVILIATGIKNPIFLNKCLNINDLNSLMVFACFFYMVISLVLLFKISKFSTPASKWHNIIKGYLKFFLDYAIKTGYYEKDEAKARLGEDIYNEISYPTTSPTTTR